MSDSPLMRFANPDAVIHTGSLPDNQNALALLRAAGASLMQAEEISELTAWFDDCECGEPTCPACHRLEQREFDRRATAVLQENREALRQFHAGVQRGQLQLPIAPPVLDDEQFSLGEAREFCRLLTLKAALAQHAGQPQESAAAIEQALAFGRMMAHSGLIVQFLVGIPAQGVALARAEDLAAVPLDDSMRRTLLRCLDLVLDKHDIIDALRRELCLWSIPLIDQLDAMTSLDAMLDKLIASCFFTMPMMTFDENWTDDGRLAQRRDEISTLLQGHPQPWEAAGTVRLLSDHVAAQIAALQSNQPAPNWPESQDAWWPPALSPAVPYEYLGHSAEAKAARAELAVVMKMAPESFTLYDPLSRETLFEHQARLREIDNPLGRMLAASSCSVNLSDALERLTEQSARLREKLS